MGNETRCYSCIEFRVIFAAVFVIFTSRVTVVLTALLAFVLSFIAALLFTFSEQPVLDLRNQDSLNVAFV